MSGCCSAAGNGLTSSPHTVSVRAEATSLETNLTTDSFLRAVIRRQTTNARILEKTGDSRSADSAILAQAVRSTAGHRNQRAHSRTILLEMGPQAGNDADCSRNWEGIPRRAIDSELVSVKSSDAEPFGCSDFGF